MKHIIIGTHGELSKEFIETAKLIAGEDIKIRYLCMTKGKSVGEAEKEARNLLDSKHKYIVLTDVFGGSVCNLFTSLLNEYDFDLLTGVNLPMVLTTLLSNQSSTALVEEVVQESRNGIQYVNDLIKKEAGGDDLDDLFNES